MEEWEVSHTMCTYLYEVGPTSAEKLCKAARLPPDVVASILARDQARNTMVQFFEEWSPGVWMVRHWVVCGPCAELCWRCTKHNKARL